MNDPNKVRVEGRMVTVVFPHCASCSYLTRCYPDGDGPRLLDPECGEGPA